MFPLKPKPIGLPPGALIHTGRQKSSEITLNLIDYDADHHLSREQVSLEECLPLKETASVSWINLSGLHDIDLLQQLGDAFSIHSLALEDVLNTGHLPKCEEFDGYLLLIFKLLHINEQSGALEQEQISMLVGPNWLLTFQEKPEDIFDRLRERINRANGRIRQRGTDYLAYAILDSVVDSYFHVLAHLGERLESMENKLLLDPDSQSLQDIHKLRQELALMRRSVWPLQIAITEFQHIESSLLSEETAPFLRDLLDHISHAVESVEMMRDGSSNLLDLYLSLASQKMNETMKVLTIMASIFIPLTFIAGIYGMNFENMPELKLAWGYPTVWLVMIGCALGMVWYFRRKKWF